MKKDMEKGFSEYPASLKVIRFDTCGSTNTYLKDNYEKLKDKLPILVSASQQETGRGRGPRQWISRKDLGLYSSFGFHLMGSQKLNFLSLTAGISVVETLGEIEDLDYGLKWPNDVMYEGKKISGVLIENRILTSQEVFCIVGIGINLNHSHADFPGELAGKAISLKMISGKAYEIEKINKILAHTFFLWLEKLKHKDNEEEIVSKANMLGRFLLRQHITFHQKDRVIKGIYQGINHDGGVIIEAPPGSTTVYYSGEIE